MGGGDTPSPTPTPTPVTISFYKANGGVETAYEIPEGQSTYSLVEGDSIVAKFSRPITASEIPANTALYLINEDYQGIVIVNNGSTLSAAIMMGLDSYEETDSKRAFDYPELPILNTQFAAASEITELSFGYHQNSWGPNYIGPLEVTPNSVAMQQFNTVTLGSTPVVVTNDNRIVLCGFGYKEIDWDSQYPDYSCIALENGQWKIGEGMVDFDSIATLVKDYIAQNGYYLIPDGEYLNSQLLAINEGEFFIVQAGGAQSAYRLLYPFSCPAMPTVV